MDNIDFIKYISLSIAPVLFIGITFYVMKEAKKFAKENLIFNVGKRELIFNLKTKQLNYKDKTFTPSVRTFGDMKKLYTQNSLSIDDDKGRYFMYRDVYFDLEDKKILEKNKIRYDITIILPEIIGGEYSKTYGHYHPKNSKGEHFQELYQVLSGEAIYLQQNSNNVFYTKASEKEAVNMDESYGHITINPSEDKILVMANLVDETFSSVYDDYKSNNGGNYYLFDTGWEKNPHYENDLNLEEKFEKFDTEDSIYDDFLKNPNKFNYLH